MTSQIRHQPLIVYIDVDDTLIRSSGTKRIPMPATVAHIRALKAQGAILYCWSSGGASYARHSAEEAGVADCFTAFLPKPHVLIDDQQIIEWRRLLQVHPNNCRSTTVDEYWQQLLPPPANKPSRSSIHARGGPAYVVPEATPPNTSLQRTLVNVAKIHINFQDYLA